ncbi:BN159_2729 family protein [Streptomyces sp. NBC_01017]|uniref:BN159_2729 family protein n=1 Tax=Streptomyces sp. NBC_01017 TaxID=2903721 RepID=UPI00386D078C|nr:BN159_2729 family protein [Streptomyces sp. NBC_01017]
MNKNLPHAVRVIRAALASSGSDPATAIAHTLNDARLLVDPERFGRVLHRTPAGGWSDRQQPAATELTDLEQQALAWDQSCARAEGVAAAIKKQIGEHPEFQNVQVDQDRVLVALHITDQAQWVQWRAWFGITHDKEQPLPYAIAGDGYRDGVRVSVVAYDLPQARTRAVQSAKRPFVLDGDVYDLSVPQQDSRGGVWFFQGARKGDGMPLLSIDGRSERCSLAGIVAQFGPLTAVTDSTTPVTAPQGGERA